MNILLVEDSPVLLRSLCVGLERTGFSVTAANDGEEAHKALMHDSFDVVILDIMIPKVSGLELLTQMRSRGDYTSVLILSAKDTTENRIHGLDLGADDYLVKPFSFDELVSRINALSRRSRTQQNIVDDQISYGNLNLNRHHKSSSYNNTELNLTPHAYALLELLLSRQGQVYSQDQLMSLLYAGNKIVTRNTLEAHISALRKKLRDAGAPDIIKTRRGFGYFIPAIDSDVYD